MEDLKKLEQVIGYTFNQTELLNQARSHTSYCFENNQSASDSNEKLEFLGDAVLELSVSGFIFNEYPELTEGDLTRLRAAAVCEPSIAEAARELSLGGFLKISKGEEQSGGRQKDSILSDAFEALIGAIYLDGGFDAAKGFILKVLEQRIRKLRHRFMYLDSKTLLQEYFQRTSREPLKYLVVDERGADHEKIYLVDLSHEGVHLSSGEGKSKKEAEQNAAYNYIVTLEEQGEVLTDGKN